MVEGDEEVEREGGKTGNDRERRNLAKEREKNGLDNIKIRG